MWKAVPAAMMVSLAMAAAALAGPFEDGMTAYQSGDYTTAARVWRVLAETGDVQSQFHLGLLYESGLGVRQDYIESARWLRRNSRPLDHHRWCQPPGRAWWWRLE